MPTNTISEAGAVALEKIADLDTLKLEWRQFLDHISRKTQKQF